MKGKICLCNIIVEGPKRRDMFEVLLTNPNIETVMEKKENIIRIIRRIKGKSFHYDELCNYKKQYKIKELTIIKQIGVTNYEI